MQSKEQLNQEIVNIERQINDLYARKIQLMNMLNQQKVYENNSGNGQILLNENR